jgi:hypothetical protein
MIGRLTGECGLDLPPCPPPGSGVHRWIMSAANRLAHRGGSADDAMQIVTRRMTRRPRPISEVFSAVSKAYQLAKVSNVCVRRISEASDSGRADRSVLFRAWPVVNSEQRIAVIAAVGAGLVELWEISPIKFESPQSNTDEILNVLFPGNPLLCCGRTNSHFDTRLRRQWQGRLSDSQFIVPSPMTSRMGLTRAGRVSRHSLENTGPRRFLVIEQDNGTTDEQAAILLHLAEFAPLALAIHSGGKSIHGWFYCAQQPDDKLRRLMSYAVSLGADPATWTKSQFVRMPDGLRDNGRRQVAYFLNPRVIV